MDNNIKKWVLLNDLIGVYKKNFPIEADWLDSNEQESLAFSISSMANHLQKDNLGLTTITIKSKINN